MHATLRLRRHGVDLRVTFRSAMAIVPARRRRIAARLPARAVSRWPGALIPKRPRSRPRRPTVPMADMNPGARREHFIAGRRHAARGRAVCPYPEDRPGCRSTTAWRNGSVAPHSRRFQRSSEEFRQQFLRMTDEEIADFRLLSGHFELPFWLQRKLADRFVVSLVREPVERVLSGLPLREELEGASAARRRRADERRRVRRRARQRHVAAQLAMQEALRQRRFRRGAGDGAAARSTCWARWN